MWEERVLTPRVRELLRRAGGALFEDSLEIETDATIWTPGFLEEFERRRGHSLLPHLPGVLRRDERAVFRFDDGSEGAVVEAVDEVRSELYLEGHLVPLRDWAHSLGLLLRVQPYGLQTDALAAAALMDVPEGETLGFKDLDDFRSLAGGRDMGGGTVLSSEAAAVFGGSYSVTWEGVARTMAREYSAGVDQAVLHGFPYADAPGAQWPGFAAFTPCSGGLGYSEAWGPRQPTWRHAPDVAGYLGRTQLVLQRGTNRVDVAFLRQKGYAGSGFGAPWFSAEGVRLGWTHEFLSPRLLDLPSATVRDGRLAPDGPGFRLLVLEGDAFRGRAQTLPVRTAEKLVELARAGLPVLLVGPWDAATVPGVPQPGETERVRELVAELLALPGVVRVDAREDIPAGVAATGLVPDLRHAEPSPLLHARRLDGTAELFHLVNSSDAEAVDHEVVVRTQGPARVPFSVDPWTGEVRRLGLYRQARDEVALPVRLAPGQSTLVALATPGWAGTDRRGSLLHATASDADEVLRDGRRLVARSTTARTVTTTLSNRRTVRREVGPVPAEVGLETWHLDVDDWRPGATPTETQHVQHSLELTALAPWTQLPGLADVAGVGTYTTTVQLGDEWSAGDLGAALDLGEVSDTVRVRVNGRSAGPVDLVRPVVPVGHLLRPGANTVEVEVASNLINRLRTTRPDVYAVARRSDWGLVGPVVLRPHRQVEVA